MSGILGDVNDGWFAQIAHFGENMGRFFGLGSLYDDMETSAGQRMGDISKAAYDRAIAAGKTPAEATAIANAELSRYSDPQNGTDLGDLLSSGFGTMRDAVNKAVEGVNLSDASPLLIGAGILGGGYLLADSLSGSGTPVTPRPARMPTRDI